MFLLQQKAPISLTMVSPMLRLMLRPAKISQRVTPVLCQYPTTAYRIHNSVGQVPRLQRNCIDAKLRTLHYINSAVFQSFPITALNVHRAENCCHSWLFRVFDEDSMLHPALTFRTFETGVAVKHTKHTVTGCIDACQL